MVFYHLHNNFNSIKVRLEQFLERTKPLCLTNFNSIKVRLEHQKNESFRIYLGFQFHKGTIRTRRWLVLVLNNKISIP